MSVPLRINRASVDPTVNNDFSLGYQIGWAWANTVTRDLFVCTDPTEGSAVWELKPTITSNTFTPILQFGGGSAGITYDVQQGIYRKIHDIMFISIKIDLTSKGTDTGSATIIGLPFSAAVASEIGIFTTVISSPTTNPVIRTIIPASSNTINIVAVGPNLSNVDLNNADFDDTSTLTLSGIYFL